MATVKEQYDDYLDTLHEDGGLDLSAYRGSRILEEVDPIAYRCGMNDYQPSCERCGEPFCADSDDDEAICPDCQDDGEPEEE